MFYPQCLDAVKESMHSFAKQIASGGNLATAFSKLKTDTTNAYYGTSVVVTKGSFDDWIDWEKKREKRWNTHSKNKSKRYAGSSWFLYNPGDHGSFKLYCSRSASN